jgi:undecaprenyl-diphosphatase
VSILHAIVLGIVQGLTEYFPISSSGHLGLVPWAMGWNDFDGNESLAKAFDVALHIGTLFGAVVYFRKDIANYLREGFRPLLQRGGGKREWSTDGKIAWLLVASAIPAAIVGALLADTIERLDDEIWLTAVLLIVFGLILGWADRLPGTRQVEEWSPKDAGGMGVGQALALMPGVSRSGVTITVARYFGFTRDSAARLAFLMSLPVTGGAVLYKFVDVQSEGGIPPDFRAAFAAGILASGISGWFAVWGTIKFVRTHSFDVFVIYRVVVGSAVLIALAAGFRGGF